MTRPQIQNLIPSISLSFLRMMRLACLLTLISVGPSARGQAQILRPTGRTLIEGENFSAAARLVKVERSDRCSGKETLAYFWGNTWAEWDITAPKLLNYNLTLRASAGKAATEISVQLIDSAGDKKAVTTIPIPKTETWGDYMDTKPVQLSIPAGRHTLRFRNLVEGANIDFITFAAGISHDVVTVTPATNDGPNINPLKGFVSSWNRKNDDHASVGFQYLDWRTLEPKDDEFDWAAVEQVIDRAGSKGRHLILQLVVDWDDNSKTRPIASSHYRGPRWLRDLVGEQSGPAFPKRDNSRITRATRYNNPGFVAEAKEAIAALSQHFEDDPRIFVLQAGVLGFKGEWHTNPRADWGASNTTKFAILDAYTRHRGDRTFNQVRFPNEPIIEPQEGLGYTNSKAIPNAKSVKFAEAVTNGELWKNGPIGGEWPQHAEPKYWEQFFLSAEGLDFIQQAHYSTLLIPDQSVIASRLPGWNPDGLFQKMHRQLGYNFQVSAARHLVATDQSRQTHVEIDLCNIGIAPFYQNWQVQLAAIDSATLEPVEIVETGFDIRKIGPGRTATIAASFSIPLDQRTQHQIGLRIIQSGAQKRMTVPWKLDARNTYIELANSVQVVEGTWARQESRYHLQGGWNLLDVVERRDSVQPSPIKGQFFPLRGSFRPN